MSARDEEFDVCLIVEGAYPFVTGGVAGWLQELIVGLPDISFSIVAIKANEDPQPWRFDPPPNVGQIVELPLSMAPSHAVRIPSATLSRIGKLLIRFLLTGGPDTLRSLTGELAALQAQPTTDDIMSSPEVFELLTRFYNAEFPTSSFHHFFWSTRILLSGLLSVLLAPLPRARCYHTLSTGFAGLMAARATYETGRPALLTEHGIYLLERHIEVMMADWIGDRIDYGLVLDRDEGDLRDLWYTAFKSYARACYDACDEIIALYEANSAVQKRLGAAPDRLRVIPNGVKLDRFEGIGRTTEQLRPLVALIGRVVPIKDIKTFIRAAALVHAEFPRARFVVLGPLDEDKVYAAECEAMVDKLGLGDFFEFAGRVDVVAWMPRIDILVLTSLSEAQPLVILEAGACGIPSIAPDVGSCRQMIEGSGSDVADGGIITALVDPKSTATAILRMLRSPDLRNSMGMVIRDRVRREYQWHDIVERYRQLYSPYL